MSYKCGHANCAVCYPTGNVTAGGTGADNLPWYAKPPPSWTGAVKHVAMPPDRTVGKDPRLGAPFKANVDTFALPVTAAARKRAPMATGVLDYFKNALYEVAKVSKAGNDQHNPPNEPMHWAKGKSNDHADCIMRHLAERGTYDTDGLRHSAKVAWRALALLQEELEAEVRSGVGRS